MQASPLPKMVSLMTGRNSHPAYLDLRTDSASTVSPYELAECHVEQGTGGYSGAQA